MAQCVLYQWQPGYGLSSLSPACLQVAAYLKLAGIDFTVESCSSTSVSPTGQLPALEIAEQLVDTPPGNDFAAARAIISYLQQRVVDLDAALSPGQRAELLAFTTLLTANLEPATVYTTWCEDHSYSQYTREVYGASLPVPLKYLIPWNQRRAVLQRFASTTADKVYRDAGAVYAAVAEQITARSHASRQAGSSYYFGDKPSSLDALLYGHLIYHATAPVTAPELASEVTSQPVLTPYLQHIASGCSTTVPEPPHIRDGWQREQSSSSRAGRPSNPSAAKKVETEEEKRVRRRGQFWLAGAVAAIVGYIVLGGQYFSIEYEYDDEDEADQGED